MAIKVKCDRCKKEFDPKYMKGNVTEINFHDMWGVDVREPYSTIHVCQTCMEVFREVISRI